MSGRKIIFEDTLAMVLAGGQGERLHPLTRDRSKPAVPFGGPYRIIDFTLSNCLNSGLRRIYVLTQYKSGSLERHIQLGWDSLFSVELGEWIYTVPPQLRIGQRWYEGTADAVFHNVYLIERERPARIVVLSGDHVYKMDYRCLIEYHLERGAVATVAAVEVPLADAHAFGVMQVDGDWRITSFTEKPAQPEPMPGREDCARVNMGVYCFETDALIEAVTADAGDPGSLHDFAHDVLPRLVGGGRVFAYPFVDENRGGQLYWRDIGTIDAYYAASMDLVAVDPVFNLYDSEWTLRTMTRQLPPAKTVFAEEWPGGRAGVVLNCLVCGGVVVSGGRVERSILAPEVRVNSFAQVSDSVLLDGVQVGRHARVRRAIVDKRAVIPPGYVIGEDLAADRARFTVSEGGIVVIPQGARLD
ncbi:MAG: glucose-1-phosphate adenylyltransferase [Acidobacteria bacterium]|nr:glucose-1-phosphate adenylyltransferase [Acidobacteriota bacterium]